MEGYVSRYRERLTVPIDLKYVSQRERGVLSPKKDKSADCFICAEQGRPSSFSSYFFFNRELVKLHTYKVCIRIGEIRQSKFSLSSMTHCGNSLQNE